MPGYHKSYQKGTSKARKTSPSMGMQAPPRMTPAQMARVRASFPQTLPPQSPDEMREASIRAKIDEVYGKGFQPPYDDDAPPPRGMRLVKENLTGRQMNIAKKAAPFDKITGADFKKLREMLMGRGKADAKVYQDGTGSMQAAVEEVKKQNPEATEEEITNFLLNPEAGFQEGQKGKWGSISMYEPLPTYEQFFRDELGYFPEVRELPRDNGKFTPDKLINQDPKGNAYYTDLDEVKGNYGNIWRGEVDYGQARAFGDRGGGRYKAVEDIREYDPNNDSNVKGVRYFNTQRGIGDLRSAITTQEDVDKMNKKYAEFMKSVQMQPQRQGARLVPTATGFKLVGTQSQIDAREKGTGSKENAMGSKMYIR